MGKDTQSNLPSADEGEKYGHFVKEVVKTSPKEDS